MFFALSGFLVTGSYFRTKNIRQFVLLRVLRIVPALGVEVALCALILGSLLTTWSLQDYYTNSMFWSYFANVVGYIHFHLPGVFLDNPEPGFVNRSLWTVPSELECYIALVGAAIVGLLRVRMLFFLALVFGHIEETFGFVHYLIRGEALRTFDFERPVGPHMLVLCFLAGVFIFLCKDRIVHSWTLMLASLGGSILLLELGAPSHLIPIPVAYATVALGLSNPPRLWLVRSGDYSYGIYLYAFPVQQTVANLFPHLREWYWNVAVALPATLLFAAFSWHYVEKHALKLRRIMAPARSTPQSTTAPPIGAERLAKRPA
jgi:peptidoglycan/LPS O-acetylase OafA/YrhL